MKLHILHFSFAAFALTSCSRQQSPALIEQVKSGVALLEVMDANGNGVATGTGFWVSEDGKLVSNSHVIRDAEKVTARAYNGATFAVSGVLFEDLTNDVVILQTVGTGFPRLPLGTTATARQGDKVVVVGSPMGLQGSASEGIVSAFRKESGGDLIQLTAPISPGSSGSPVIDQNGQVIGVARLTLEGGQSLNFAVPIEVVKNAINGGLSKQAKPFSDG